MNPLITKRCSPIEEAIYQDGFQAGAASRDAEVAELVAAQEEILNEVDISNNLGNPNRGAHIHGQRIRRTRCLFCLCAVCNGLLR